MLWGPRTDRCQNGGAVDALTAPPHIWRVTSRLEPSSFCDATAYALTSIHIDLSPVTFATPGGVVALATFVDSAVAVGHTVSGVTAPTDTSAANYLSRAHVGRLLDARQISHDLPAVRERELGARLVELRSFSGHLEIQALAAAAFDFAEQAQRDAGSPLHDAICELGDNVATHSGWPHGYAVAQYFPATRDFEFAVGDAGKGFLASLADQGATTHESAHKLALTPGVSGAGDGRGVGLSSISIQLAALGGSLTLVSGDRRTLTYSQDKRLVSDLNYPVGGAIVTGRFGRAVGAIR